MKLYKVETNQKGFNIIYRAKDRTEAFFLGKAKVKEYDLKVNRYFEKNEITGVWTKF